MRNDDDYTKIDWKC